MSTSAEGRERVLNQFQKLMQDLLRGSMNRNCFRTWEIQLLLDIETCQLRPSARRATLRRYQRAFERHLERGGDSLLKLSDFLAQKRRK